MRITVVIPAFNEAGNIGALVEETIAGPGHVTWWFDRPHDIHNQQGVGGPVRELVLFGRNTSRIPRRYFDPEAGTVREALPM